MSTPGLPDEISLGEWTFRPREGELERRGARTRLEPKVAALLAHLVGCRARLVTREELLSAVWPDSVVAPIALARGVSELRRALGDDVRAPRYIRTFPKRGYRWVGPVGPAPAEPQDLAPVRIAAAPVGRAAVARGRALRVAATAFALALSGWSPAGPPAVFEGVPAPMTAPPAPPGASGVEAMWNACRERLGGGTPADAAEAQRCLETVVQRDPDFTPARLSLAWALAFQSDHGGAGAHARAAAVQVERLVREHPRSADAHAMFSLVHTVLRRHARARAGYERALRLEPDSRAALRARALALSRRGRRDDSARAHLALASLDAPPLLASINLGVDLRRLGYDSAARRSFERVEARDPSEVVSQVGLAFIESDRGDGPAARARLQRLVRAKPACQSCLLVQAELALSDGDQALAGRALDRAARWPGAADRIALLRARLALDSGDRARVPVWLDVAEGEARGALSAGDEGWQPLYMLASVAALRGDAAAAADWYRRAVASGADLYRWDRDDRLFARVRDDPRFVAALREAEQQFDARRRRVQDLRLPERVHALSLMERPTRTAD